MGPAMGILHALQNTWPAQLVGGWPWWFPILEITHLTGITVVFGGMVILGERLLVVQMIGGVVIILGVFLVNRPG